MDISVNKELNFLVYKAVNSQNGDTYIGTTSRSVEERIKDHLQKSDCTTKNKFHNAISTYGLELFVWEIIDTANSIDELARKEKQYIFRYNSMIEGYNSDSGGGFKKTVYQYSLEDGKLIADYDNLESAGSAVSASKKQISRACLSVNNSFGGYYWSYKLQDTFTPKKDKRLKEVSQYDLGGTLIRVFRSVCIASKETGVNKSSIAKVCRGERNTAGGYIWQFN
ncbi:GIY-YIG nuclease family protein [Psychroserpens sp. XS_ASV72]|uniref:GIY-YIG nuclease family protein n=1 Tax=Psychroserpens sp. XS_ASV72 TaxID=3241293 RepID=UPI00351648DB